MWWRASTVLTRPPPACHLSLGNQHPPSSNLIVLLHSFLYALPDLAVCHCMVCVTMWRFRRVIPHYAGTNNYLKLFDICYLYSYDRRYLGESILGCNFEKHMSSKGSGPKESRILLCNRFQLRYMIRWMVRMDICEKGCRSAIPAKGESYSLAGDSRELHRNTYLPNQLGIKLSLWGSATLRG